MNESGSPKGAGRYGHTALLVNRYMCTYLIYLKVSISLPEKVILNLLLHVHVHVQCNYSLSWIVPIFMYHARNRTEFIKLFFSTFEQFANEMKFLQTVCSLIV